MSEAALAVLPGPLRFCGKILRRSAYPLMKLIETSIQPRKEAGVRRVRKRVTQHDVIFARLKHPKVHPLGEAALIDLYRGEDVRKVDDAVINVREAHLFRMWH